MSAQTQAQNNGSLMKGVVKQVGGNNTNSNQNRNSNYKNNNGNGNYNYKNNNGNNGNKGNGNYNGNNMYKNNGKDNKKNTPKKPLTVSRGILKRVLSGDSVIIRGMKGAPPPERHLNFSSVIAPKIARRATATLPESQDEPCGWKAREFLRSLVIGKEVFFSIETKTSTGREYGTIYVGKEMDKLTNVTELMISEGLLSVRRESIRGNESHLTELEDAAKASGKGKWATDAHENVRNIKWNVDDVRAFVDEHKGKPMKAIIEHVRDGSTVRAFLLPDFHHITMMITGIKCPAIKMDSESKPDKTNSEPYAEEAKYFVESRLLQREVDIVLEGQNNNNFYGSIKHPNGNIAVLLLKEGFAKIQIWTINSITEGANKLKEAEKSAMNKKLRLWASYTPQLQPQTDAKEKEFSGKVCEIINGESLLIKNNKGVPKKIFLSSIRQPRNEQSAGQNPVRNRPLYDTPFLYEAREFLRKKLIGQEVHVTVDYIQPRMNQFPEKICCTVKIEDANVALELVSKGLATVYRHRQDDDNRSSCYDELLSAEAKAAKEGNGLHSKKDVPIHRIQDISVDPTKAKAFFPCLSRAGKIDAVVEYVTSGSRVRLFIPKETCLITFLLAGISCPKAPRATPGNPGVAIPGDPYGAEALEFSKDNILQKEVEIEIESMDKGGNFIGWLFFDNQNLSVKLVEKGLSSVHNTAEGTKYNNTLLEAEQSARKKKINIWLNYVEQEKTEKTDDTNTERRMDPKLMMISEVTRDGRIFAQYCSDGSSLESMMDNIRQEFTERPPVAGAFTPRKGALCAAKFTDGSWYRAKVEKVWGGQVSIFYVDYGNREVTTAASLSVLPPQFNSAPNYAHEFGLALVKFPKDEDIMVDAVEFIMTEVGSKEMKVNREYKGNGLDFCTFQLVDSKVDLAKSLLSQGLVMLEMRKEKRLQQLLNEYLTAQEEAKRKHLNIWQYGDATEDDAFEFGMEK